MLQSAEIYLKCYNLNVCLHHQNNVNMFRINTFFFFKI